MLIFDFKLKAKTQRQLQRLLHHVKGKKRRKQVVADFLKKLMNPGLDIHHKRHKPKKFYPKVTIENKGRDYPNYRPFRNLGTFVPWAIHLQKSIAKAIKRMSPKAIKKHIYHTVPERRPRYVVMKPGLVM